MWTFEAFYLVVERSSLGLLTMGQLFKAALSQSEEISSDFCCFYGGGIRHNEDIMHSFQNFIVRLIPNHPPPLETRIWKLVVRALVQSVK